MDIVSLGFTYPETKRTGRMPYDLVDMFKLYIYKDRPLQEFAREVDKRIKAKTHTAKENR